MRTFIFIFLVFVGWLSLNGQNKNALALFKTTTLVADEFYANFDYRNALHFYSKALEKNIGDDATRLKIVDCYLKLNDPKHAESLLAELVNDNSEDVRVLTKYAEVLRMNGKLEEAAIYYEKIMLISPSTEIESKLEFIRNIGYYRDPSTYTVTNSALNSNQSDFSPQYFKDGLLFLSARQTDKFIQYQPSTATNDDEGMLRYFYADKETITHYEYGDKLKSTFHDGPFCFYNNQSNVAFTRNNLREGQSVKGVKVNLKIFFADCLPSNTWEIRGPFPFNSDQYSVGHPSLNESGTVMYFSSDMPGGFGGSDIYVSRFDGNTWSTPENAGSAINTSGSELFPYLYNESTLYFASTGHGGFGGLDIFKSSLNDTWSKVTNLGAPINSEADDFGLLLDQNGRGGYFSSNRTGGQGQDDIYTFFINKQLVVGVIRQQQNDQTKLTDATVSIFDSQNNEISSTLSDSLGMFRVTLPPDQNFFIQVAKEGHSSSQLLPFNTSGSVAVDTLEIALWKHELFAKGRLYSNETQMLIPNATVLLENTDIGIRDSVITTADGSYTFALTPNYHYHITAKASGYLDNGFRMNTKGLLKGDLLNDILLEEVYVDKHVTYFQYNSSKIDPAYEEELKQVLRTLKKYPKAILTITAHADARGTVEYNKKLSQKRVDVISEYFTTNGIKKERIHGTAFGEELLLNQCSDGVDCGEEDHSLNRRAEIKVQMTAIH